ncbi:phosphoprotein phosphatase-like protein [Leptomonas pyrrhocoris]|uniref:Phosphoprotein phosphatase-like protein n=1 Tax=Leptomonas pyrrhocoris TaxID=157538 RepID=A0A0M9FUV3_LEPPY|nr:phosphoprotein phosphatase-like protein [Leptomonas pyrrhocoris]KPA76346.1 phosphoprotein phosphatase-like protein [Leptomonas pyrrhocoris]|eukprot:XP_015654785.1 phosphoprotein phosphatase-like protein [Leptomonas pyrrhocoris]
MEKALQLVFSQQVKDGAADAQACEVPMLRPACIRKNPALDHIITCETRSAGTKANNEFRPPSTAVRPSEESGSPSFLYNSNKTVVLPPSTASPSKSNGLLNTPDGFADAAISPQNSPSVLTTGANSRLKLKDNLNCSGSAAALNTHSAAAGAAATGTTMSIKGSRGDLLAPVTKPPTLLKSLAASPTAALPNCTYDIACRSGRAAPLPGMSDSSDSVASSDDADADAEKKLLLSEAVEVKGKSTFFKAKPRLGEFASMIEWLLRCGEAGEIALPSNVTENGAETPPPPTFFTEDNIAKLCTAATQVLSAEPGLLELDVPADDTLIVVGDIHGQFQDLYTSVLCQQYDRRRCNPGGLDRHFLFMGDYVDRGPHSLEVVLLLLALKVEYPSLVYLTRGNHEEEKTSRVYGFLTEATSSLGAVAGGAVWSAVNKVFLDLPLAAIVQTPHMRFFVTHGGLSPALKTTDQIAAIDRHAYNTGALSKEEHDIVDGLLWSDPAIGIGCFAPSARGCGWNFGPATSANFCSKNRLNFICRAHQLAMDGYFWTHNDRVVTVFSAPNYCGINGNRGAVMVVSGNANKPSFDQYECYEDEMEYGGQPSANFPYSSYFC